MKSRKYMRLVLINAVVLMALFALVEVIAMIYLEVLFAQEMNEKDRRVELSVYENEPWANTYFEEKERSLSAYESYYGWKSLPFKGETIHIDRNGHRKTSEIAGAIGLPIRVAFLGGSTMLGVGSRDHETIPSQFVTQGKGKYKAVNYGEGAFSAYQSYIYYQTEILRGGEKPDLLITYDGVNNSSIGRGQFEHMREKQMKNAMRGADHDKSSFMENTKHLIEKLKKRNTKDKKIGLSPNTKKTQEAAAIELLESWLLMKYLCDRMGSKFLCILQPNGFMGKPDLKHIPGFYREERREFFDYYELVKTLVETPKYAELRAHFIDMTSAFDHIPLVYIDFSHVSPKGNEVIAGLLLESLEDRNWFKEK